MTKIAAGLLTSVVTFLLCCGSAFGQIDEAKAAIERREFVRAVNILSDALATRPSADAYLYLGIAYGNMKEYEKAQDTLKEGSDRFPDDVRFHTEMAGIYLAMRQPDDAKAELRRALAVDSNNSYASDMLASIDMSEGETQKALRFWNKSGQPVIDEILHNYYVTFGSAVVQEALAFSPASVLKYAEWKTTEARLFATNNFNNVALEVEPTPLRDHYNAVVRTTARTNTITDLLWNAFRGLPMATTHLNFWNIGDSGTNWKSSYRWDPDRHRAHGSLEMALPVGPLLHMSVGNTWRSERWDLTPSIRSAFLDRGRRLDYRSNSVELYIRSIPHYRIELGGGFEYVNRYAKGNLPELATDSRNTGKLKLDTTIRLADGVYQNRLHLDGFAARRSIIGDFNYTGATAELNNRVTLSTRSRMYVDWTIKGGTSRGARPLEDYFMLGLDAEPQNVLRGHSLADHGRYGAAPTGTDFVLGNFDVERRIVTMPFFNSLNIPYVVIKAEAFVDAAKAWDRTRIFSNTELLMDAGGGFKFETPTASFNVIYGRSLRDGGSVLFGYVERRLW
jgi:tetratricopeptide (TPR) repeat protein